MDRSTRLLAGLRAQLTCWVDPIKRGVGATDVELADAPDGAFVLRAKWAGEKVHERLFDGAFVFGPSPASNPLALRVQKRACDYARDFMREILSQRGAL